jgi:hypothetical protein
MNSTKSEIQVSIINPPEHKFLAVAIRIGNEQWAELNQEEGVFALEIYPRPDKQPWRISYKDALEALTKAKQRLIGEY